MIGTEVPGRQVGLGLLIGLLGVGKKILHLR